MDLEGVFVHFLNKFESLPNPRSVAEASVTAAESEALTRWFAERWELGIWCESTWLDDLPGESAASRREMLGALLLILASELCRDKSTEDAVWPDVTEVLRANKVSYSALFVAGQPTTACKKALAAGAHRLNLRNLIDRYGAQEYFDTIKLQFGFTLRGAMRRLPEWLDGLGPPIAVRILSGIETEYGDLGSSSFAGLWKTLQGFRRSRVSEEYAAALLRTSPWVRPEWTTELLRAAKLRPHRTFSELAATGTLDHSSEPICEPMLRWEEPSRPQFVLRLNDERICEVLGARDKATFAVDGRVVDRWTAHEVGGWRGKRELPCQPEGARPNLRPRLLSVSSEDNLIEEIDLSELGMGEPLLIFDHKSGSQIDPASRLDPKRDYALICDADLSIPDADPPVKLKTRSAYRLTSPWPLDVRIFCDGILYWQARVDEEEPCRSMRLTLESPSAEVVEIGSTAQIRVTGVPGDATAVSLVTGASAHSVTQHGEVWQTVHPVPITLAVALGEERLRVRVTGANYARTIVPKLSLGLQGIACIESDSSTDEPQWKLLNRRRPLNRADGSGRARIFVRTPRPQLYEGACLVTRIGSRALPLRDLYGWGAPLVVRSESQSDLVLVDSVEDCGLGRFLPPLFGGMTGAWLSWRVPVAPSNEHEVLVWSDISQDPRRLHADKPWSQQDDLVWKLPSLGSVAAMATVYHLNPAHSGG